MYIYIKYKNDYYVQKWFRLKISFSTDILFSMTQPAHDDDHTEKGQQNRDSPFEADTPRLGLPRRKADAVIGRHRAPDIDRRTAVRKPVEQSLAERSVESRHIFADERHLHVPQTIRIPPAVRVNASPSVCILTNSPFLRSMVQRTESGCDTASSDPVSFQ